MMTLKMIQFRKCFCFVLLYIFLLYTKLILSFRARGPSREPTSRLAHFLCLLAYTTLKQMFFFVAAASFV